MWRAPNSDDYHGLPVHGDTDAIPNDVAFHVVLASVRSRLDFTALSLIFNDLPTNTVRSYGLFPKVPDLPVYVVRTRNRGLRDRKRNEPILPNPVPLAPQHVRAEPIARPYPSIDPELIGRVYTNRNFVPLLKKILSIARAPEVCAFLRLTVGDLLAEFITKYVLPFGKAL